MPPSVPRGGGVPSAGARGARISPSNAGLIALGIMSICVLGHKVLLHQEQVEADRWQAFQERVVRKVDRSVDKLIRSQERLDTRIAKLSAHVDAVRVAGAGAAAGDRDAPARGHRKLRRGKGRRAGGTDDDDEDGGGAVEAGRAGAAASCGEGHRPFHTLLTAQSSVYQQWQSRIMYFHWKKQRDAGGECTEMVGFTRLTATPGGRPDGLENEIPSIFTVELSKEVLDAHFGFGVLNRPNSIRQLLASTKMRSQLVSDYVLLCETDHVFMRPMPNLATETMPAAWVFGYMHANPSQDHIIQKYWPEGNSKGLDPVGPSPLIIHLKQLEQLAPRWMEFSLGLRATKDAEAVMQGWVQEMWGYSIAAASVGIKHRLVNEMQIEASSLTRSVASDFASSNYIFHYTYGIEYTLSGKPQGINQIGEWSLDKRHYGGDHPPKALLPPPDGANAAAYWLLNAWNEASAGTPNWPTSKSMGTIGWRRVKPTAAQLATSDTAQKVAGTKWSWGGNPGFVFGQEGALTTPWGEGSWGLIQAAPSAPGASAEEEDGIIRCTGCLFADFANANHNLRFDFSSSPPAFTATRVGDLAKVEGRMLPEGSDDRE